MSNFKSMHQNERYREPFRRGLGYAAQWLDVLHIIVEDRVDAALAAADEKIQNSIADQDSSNRDLNRKIDVRENQSKKTSGLGVSSDTDEPLPAIPCQPTDLSECARILQQRCPACFGCSKFGVSLEK